LIIACPECTSPFEVADGHIAPLVQVECPTCNFRMILDFEAANDASLREQGMAMAQGFRDEASYRLAVGAGHVAYSGSDAAQPQAERPGLRAVPEPVVEAEPVAEPTPVVVTPEPVAPELDKPPVRQPPIEPPIDKPPVRQPVVQPELEPELEQQPLEQPVEEPELDKPPVRHPQPAERRSRPTLIAHTPPPPQPVVAPQPVVQPVVTQQPEAQVETHVGPPPEADLDHLDNLDMDVDVDEPEVVTRPVVETREPQVDVPRPEPTVTPTKPTTPEEPRPPEVVADEVEVKDKGKEGKRSPVRTVLTLLLLLILLAVGGAMVWSLVQTGHPYQWILEVTGMAAPQDPKANDKADAKADAKAETKSDDQADG
jgi:hypothetical protein